MFPPIFKIWRADADAPNAPHNSVTLGAGGDNDEARVRRAAEMAAGLDAKRNEQVWPVDYRVLDGEGRLWSVRVDLVTRPTYVAVLALELPPLPPVVHVFWHGQVACEDVRLAGAPSSWPKDQLWMSLLEFADGSVPHGDRCEACWRRAPALVQRRP
jgi:hypothetical protein